MVNPFDSFSDESRRVLAFAREEALQLNHGYIGTEHLLLGLLRQDTGTAGETLRSAGIHLAQARDSVAFIIGRGEGARGRSGARST